MRLLKLIPAAAIALTAFTTFEAKAGYPSGWTEKNSCSVGVGVVETFYKLQQTNTPASYGVYDDQANKWIIENVGYTCATKWFKYECLKTSKRPTCTS